MKIYKIHAKYLIENCKIKKLNIQLILKYIVMTNSRNFTLFCENLSKKKSHSLGEIFFFLPI
jgi:hypothetical protein